MKKIVSLLLAFAVLLSVSVFSFSATSNEKLNFEVTDELLEAVKVEFDDKEISKEDILITDLEVIDETKQLVRYTVAEYGVTCEVVEQEIVDYLLYVPQRPLPQILVGSVLYDIKEAYEKEILTDDNLEIISTFESDAYTFTRTGFTPPIEEPDLKANVFVDVSAVITGDEGFWAWIWDDNTEGRWVLMNTNENETGYFVVTMSVGQNVVFARIRRGEQPDWSLVWNQTEDTQYTGEYNCAVLSYSDTIGGKMPIKWKNIDAIDKSALTSAMREAEKYIYEEADKYTTASLNVLINAYFNAQDCYESASTQAEVDDATKKLNIAISQLVLKDESIITPDPIEFELGAVLVSLEFNSPSVESLLPGFEITETRLITPGSSVQNVYHVKFAEKSEDIVWRAIEILNASPYVKVAEPNYYMQTDDFVDPTVPEIFGDVDGDGAVSIMDATLIQRHIAQLYSINEARHNYADTDKDGGISIVDATMIQRFLAQLIPEL